MDERTYEQQVADTQSYFYAYEPDEALIQHQAELAEQRERDRQRDIRDCLTAYRNAYDINDGQQLERANRLFSELTLSGQSEVRRVLYREFRRMVA